jgi:hypothetical protein
MVKAFKIWKAGFPLVSNTISNLTRKEMYGLVAKMDRDIKGLEQLVEDSHMKVRYLSNYSGILEDHTRRG